MNPGSEHISPESQGLQLQSDVLAALLPASPLTGLTSQSSSLPVLEIQPLADPLQAPVALPEWDDPLHGSLSILTSNRAPTSATQIDRLLSADGSEILVGQLPFSDSLTNFKSIGTSAIAAKEIFFIDTGVKNYQKLIAEIDPLAEIFLLDSSQDGIQQISHVLSQRQNISAIHIVSHGNQVGLSIGATDLSNQNLDLYAAQIQGWRSALTATADILLYGCNLAASQAGRTLIQRLSDLSGADIAASDNLTGTAALGGDWQLEYTLGAIEAQVFQSAYQGVLFSLTMQQLYDAWMTDSLTDLNSVTLKLDGGSVLNGSLTIAANDANSLRLSGTNLNSFIGTGLGTPDISDDRGLSLTNLNLDLVLNADFTYSYTLSGQVALTNITGLTLSADDVTVSGTEAGTIVNLSDFRLGIGGNALLGGEALAYSVQNDRLSFTGSNLYAFIGYGADTSDLSDDVGLEVNSVNFSLQFNGDDDYSYLFSDGQIGIRGIDGLIIEAEQVNVTGDQEQVSLETGSFTVGLGNIVWIDGDRLSFNVQQTQSGKQIGFNLMNANLLAGYGTETEDSSDDVGIAITNADLNINLNSDATYNYSFNNANAELRGINGVTLSAGSVSATGDQDNLSLTISDATVGFKDVINVTATSLSIQVEDTGTSANLTLSGTGISAFAGYGAETEATNDDIGLAITNANFDLQINADRSYQYTINNAAVEVRGIPGITLRTDAVNITGDDTGTAFNINLVNTILNLDDRFRLSGELLEFTTIGTGADRIVTFKGTGLAALAGYGLDTIDPSDDIGLAISNANFVLQLGADGTYHYSLDNAAVEVRGIPELTLVVDAVSAIGNANSTRVNLNNAVLNIGDFLNLSGEFIEFQIETTASGQTLSFNGSGLSGFAGYGATTANLSGDLGFAFSNANLVLHLDAEGYSYSLSNASIEVRGVPGLNLSAQNVQIDGDHLNNLILSTGAFNLAIGSVVGLAGDAFSLSLQDGQPIVISANNASALIGYGAATATTSDDLGLSITNADFSITLNSNQTYNYSITNANASLVGIDGLTLFVNQVSAIGTQDTISIATGAFQLGLDGVGYISGTGLGFVPSNNEADPLKIAATGITAFVGSGGGTADEAGIKLSNGNLGLVLYNGATPSYALVADGEGALVGVDDLRLEGSLAVRINQTGQVINESVVLGNGNTFDIVFEPGQEEQLRVEGTVHANVAGTVAFGGEFSMELFPEQKPGATDLTSALASTHFTLAEQQGAISEATYQELLSLLAAEKTRLESENSIVGEIQATVDGFAFNEDFVDLLQDRIIFQTSHDFKTGQKIIYRVGAGNTAIGGLIDGQEYYVIAVDQKSVQLAATLGGSAIDLTSVGSGTHQLSQVIDFGATNQIRVDTQQEMIWFGVEHGFTNGSQVRYDAGSNPVIGGLKQGQDYRVEVISPTAVRLKDIVTGAIVDLTSDSFGSHSFRPVLIESSSAGSNGGINIVDDTILFSSPHHLQTGDKIQYYRPYRGQAIGGTLDALLTKQDVYPYTVQVISPTKIKLLKDGAPVDLTSAGSGFHVITLIEEANGDRGHLTFHTASSIQFVNPTTVRLNYAHGLTTGQTVTLQLDPGAAYPKSPIVGLEAVAYSTQPKVYSAAHDNIYYVKVAANGNLQFALTAEDLANNIFVQIQAPSGKAGSGFRFMPTWGFDSVLLPGVIEQLGDPITFAAKNSIQVDVIANRILLPAPVDLKVGEVVEYRSAGGTAIGGLQDGVSYYVVSNLNGAIQLAMTPGGSAIDLTSAGGVGNYSFVRRGADFLTDNDIAQRRLDAGLALEERLSRDLGIQVTLQAGNVTEATSANGRGVAFREISVTYDEQQIAQTKLLAGITNGYAFMGTGFETDDEIGIKITNVDLGLVLFKTIVYSKDITEQEQMTYALLGGGSGALVGVPDLTLSGVLGIQVNRTGTVVEETIIPPGGEIQIQFSDASDFTRVTGSVSLDIAGSLGLSGSISVEQTVKPMDGVMTTQLLVGATDVSAFVGASYVTADEMGIKLTDGSLGLLMQWVEGSSPSPTYALQASGTAALVGIDGITLTGSAAIAINQTGAVVDQKITTSTGEINLSLAAEEGQLRPKVTGSLDLAIEGIVALSGDFGIETTADSLRLGAVNVNAFMGANGTGVQVNDAVLGLVLYTDATGYVLQASGTAELVGVSGVTLSGSAALEINRTGRAIEETIVTSGGDIQIDFQVENFLRVSGQLDLSVDGFASLSGHFGIQQTADTLLIGATDVNAFMGANQQGLHVSEAELGLVIYTSQAGATYALQASGSAALVGIDDLTLRGAVALELNRTGSAVNEVIATPGGSVAITYTADEGNVSRAIGYLDLDIAGMAQLSGDFGFEQNGNTLRVGALNVNAFMGANGTGVQINDAALGLVIYTDANGATYAMGAAGTVALVGVNGLTLSGDATLMVNRTGVTVYETIATAGGDVLLDYSADDFTHIVGSLNLDVAGFAQLSGNFGITNESGKLQVGATNINAFVGANGTGLQVSGAELGLVVYSSDQTYALMASGSAALVGVDGITLSGSATLEVNRTGGAVEETIATAGQPVVINYKPEEGNITRVTGSLELDIAGFAQLSGDFGFEQDGNTLRIGAANVEAFLGANGTGLQVNNSSLGMVIYTDEQTYALQAIGSAALVGINDVTLNGEIALELNRTGRAVEEIIAIAGGDPFVLNYSAAEGTITRAMGSLNMNIAGFAELSGHFGFEKNGDVLRVGATQVQTFVGANGTGLEVKDGNLGLVFYSGDAGSGYALTASGSAGLVGINDLTLNGNVTLQLNRTGQSVNELISTPGGTVGIHYSADEGTIARVIGSLNMDIAGFAQLSGDFGIEQYNNTLRIGANNVNAFVGANGTGVQISDAALGLILYTDSKTYAVNASGTAGLVGIDNVTLAGNVKLEVNRTGQAIDEIIAMPGDDIRVVFATADAVTRLQGTASINLADIIALSGAFALEKRRLPAVIRQQLNCSWDCPGQMLLWGVATEPAVRSAYN
ncbi:DUF4347 domain-containing protein [Egbenema bharatensis]|uniref:DUF4347 domain-containing protein n=1 Tax=Egbenema bharatensis TaxID=3463334 RepID=UPI003A8411A4